MQTPQPELRAVMSDEALAKLGMRSIAYIRPVSVEDLRDEVEGLDDVPGDAQFYALHRADGQRVAIMQTRETAVHVARENSMEAVNVH